MRDCANHLVGKSEWTSENIFCVLEMKHPFSTPKLEINLVIAFREYGIEKDVKEKTSTNSSYQDRSRLNPRNIKYRTFPQVDSTQRVIRPSMNYSNAVSLYYKQVYKELSSIMQSILFINFIIFTLLHKTLSFRVYNCLWKSFLIIVALRHKRK